MSDKFTQFLLELMGQLDYTAIFVLMALESSIFPVPSELVMIPAGYLVTQGQLDPWLAMLASSLGSMAGSLGSYYLALWLGRPFLLRFGKYFLVDQKHLDQAEVFMHRHGEVSIFTGRFIPGIRHLISMPAGLVRMRMTPFLVYTTVGATMWNGVLLLLGLAIGENRLWLEQNLRLVILGAVVFAALVVGVYLWWQRRQTGGATA